MHKASMLLCSLLLILVLFPIVGNAQDVVQDAVLKAAKTFRCTFNAKAFAEMNGDVPKPKTGVEQFDLIFDQINLEKGTARLIGNIGASDLIVLNGLNRISLLEVTDTGNVQITVIYAVQNADGQFKAVHSRHTAWEGRRLLPSQSYGSCLSLMP